jgi:cytoskeletal protein RodZ
MKRGQVWSMDLIIAVIVFLLAVGIFYFFTNERVNEGESKLVVESENAAETVLSDTDVGLLEGDAINETKLEEMVRRSQTDYEGLKRDLGVQNDFCVVMLDENENVILLSDGTIHDLVGFGSPDLNVTIEGKTGFCGQSYSLFTT